jgi:galacturonokinase
VRLLSPPSDAQVEALREACASRYRRPLADVRVVRAPYRVCPLGAHIDHQLGPVSAIAVGQGVLLAFVVEDSPRMRVASRDYPGEIGFAIDRPLARGYDWADYARGAAVALGATHSLGRGVSVLVKGALSEAGISSSAAVGLGYLLALAAANDHDLEARELIELDRVIENEFLGLRNGILDQSAIVLAQSGRLSVIDCATVAARYVDHPDPFVLLVVYGGVREALVGSSKSASLLARCSGSASPASVSRPVRSAGSPAPTGSAGRPRCRRSIAVVPPTISARSNGCCRVPKPGVPAIGSGSAR